MDLSKVKVIGARVLVQEISTTLSLEERGKKFGITVITDERNRPKPTQGRVVKVGTDPFLREDGGIVEGCIVHFARLAGSHYFFKGEEYRMLEFQEITVVEEPDGTQVGELA